MRPSIIGAAAIVLIAAIPALAAEITVREIVSALFATQPGQSADFSGKDLSGLDLAGTDFKGARLDGAKLFGADLTDANLSGASLVRVTLDRSTLIRANFSKADLSEATLLLPAAYMNDATSKVEAPSFEGVVAHRLRVTGLFWSVNLRGADLTEADFSSSAKNFREHGNANTKRTSCRSCDFSGAKLVRANLTHTSMRFSAFAGADLSGADLSYADFTKTDLSGVNLTGAKLVGTNFEGANLEGAVGIGQSP